MAVRSGEELLEKIKAVIGDNTDDASLELIEDVTDTITDYDSRVAEGKASEWEVKYNEMAAERDAVEAEWRKRYRDRFFGTEDNGESETVIEDGSVEEETEIKTTYEDLFE